MNSLPQNRITKATERNKCFLGLAYEDFVDTTNIRDLVKTCFPLEDTDEVMFDTYVKLYDKSEWDSNILLKHLESYLSVSLVHNYSSHYCYYYFKLIISYRTTLT